MARLGIRRSPRLLLAAARKPPTMTLLPRAQKEYERLGQNPELTKPMVQSLLTCFQKNKPATALLCPRCYVRTGTKTSFRGVSGIRGKGACAEATRFIKHLKEDHFVTNPKWVEHQLRDEPYLKTIQDNRGPSLGSTSTSSSTMSREETDGIVRELKEVLKPEMKHVLCGDPAFKRSVMVLFKYSVLDDLKKELFKTLRRELGKALYRYLLEDLKSQLYGQLVEDVVNDNDLYKDLLWGLGKRLHSPILYNLKRELRKLIRRGVSTESSDSDDFDPPAPPPPPSSAPPEDDSPSSGERSPPAGDSPSRSERSPPAEDSDRLDEEDSDHGSNVSRGSKRHHSEDKDDEDPFGQPFDPPTPPPPSPPPSSAPPADDSPLSGERSLLADDPPQSGGTSPPADDSPQSGWMSPGSLDRTDNQSLFEQWLDQLDQEDSDRLEEEDSDHGSNVSRGSKRHHSEDEDDEDPFGQPLTKRRRTG